MFKLFKKKSELDTLHLKYRKLLEESHKYSTKIKLEYNGNCSGPAQARILSIFN